MLGARDGLPHVAVRQRQPKLAVGRRARRQALCILVRWARLISQAPWSGPGDRYMPYRCEGLAGRPAGVASS